MAWFMARGGDKYDGMVQGRKRDLLGNLQGTLVEIGSGTGPNLRYLPPELRIIGVEPNPFMHRHFLEEARNQGRRAHLVQGLAESLPLPDASVDAVLSTLVLCSVGRIEPVLAEVLRILKPGGCFLFVEHVGAPEGTWLRRVQRWVKPVWRRIGEGCEPDRNTGQFLHAAGFQHVSFSRFSLPLPLVAPHIAGVAWK